jgi:Ca2+-binding EF-hand superfamily protein
MHALHFPFSGEECRVIFHEADSNGTGIIDIDEFLDHFETDDSDE